MSDAASKAPVIEVRERRISADWTQTLKNGKFHAGEPTTMLTQYHVIVDGRRVDSFLTRERAERRAAQLMGECDV